MSGISLASVKKTLYYLRRNGLKNTCYAIRERLSERKNPPYQWTPSSPEELARQRQECAAGGSGITFSIIVPCYRTQEKHLREMIDSVRSQTYPGWELILADATEDDSVERVAKTVEEERIRYVRLAKNDGIAENTNRGIEKAVGDYVGLLDHDDLLTEDALYEIACAVKTAGHAGIRPKLIYSDEDKCNGEATEYYEPNRKEEFNLDLLLSNNYICHFTVMERELIQALLLRREFEGAQDYDLVLRAAARLSGQEEAIIHVGKVLYHWRCHVSSTAENPQSKLYAYQAGRRAVQDYADVQGWAASAADTLHLGFYRLEYLGDLFEVRNDVGAIGGPLFQGGRIVGGRLLEDGSVCYAGLPRGYSGVLHRASLSQDAAAVDIRNIRVREEARQLFREVVGVPWKELAGQGIFDVSALPEGIDLIAVSLAFGRALRKSGYKILYLPECAKRL